MTDNELGSIASSKAAIAVTSPQINAQKNSGQQLNIKQAELNVQSAQEIIEAVSITPQDGVARMESLRSELDKALQSLNMATNLNFSVDAASNRFVVRVTEPSSGNVIFEVPSQAILRVAQNIESLQGIIFDKKT